MEHKNPDTVTITKKDEAKSIVIANIRQTSADRSPKDIGAYRQAVESAESMYTPLRASLYDIYKKIEIDGTLTGAWELKRIAKVRNKVLRFMRNGKKEDAFDRLIGSNMFREFITLVMQQKAWGLAGAEFLKGAEFKFIPIPLKHINPHLRKITKYQYGAEGIAFDSLPNIMVLGSKTDLGFLLKVAPYILYKQGNWGDWAQFIEKYGQPFQIYRYDLYDEGTRQQAFDMAKNAGNNLAIVIPKQLEFETQDGKHTNGDGRLQGNFNDALDKQITLTVLGNLETSTAGGGSLAKAKVQALDQSDVIADDMKDVLEVLNSAQFLRILESYGYNVAGGAFEYELMADPEALRAEIEIDRFLFSDIKLPLAHDYFYEKYARPKPANYNELVKRQQEKENATTAAAEARSQNQQKDNEQILEKKKDKSGTNTPNPNGLTFWDRIDLRIANFFDPGHKG